MLRVTFVMLGLAEGAMVILVLLVSRVKEPSLFDNLWTKLPAPEILTTTPTVLPQIH